MAFVIPRPTNSATVPKGLTEVDGNAPLAKGLVGVWPGFGPTMTSAVARNLVGDVHCYSVDLTDPLLLEYAPEPDTHVYSTVSGGIFFKSTAVLPQMQGTTHGTLSVWYRRKASQKSAGIGYGYASNHRIYVGTWSNNTTYATINTTSRSYAQDDLLWHHGVMAFADSSNGNVLELWIDGELISTGASTTTSTDTANRVWLGCAVGNSPRSAFYDARIYNRRLSHAEIRQLYNRRTRHDIYKHNPQRTYFIPETERSAFVIPGRKRTSAPSINYSSTLSQGLLSYVPFSDGIVRDLVPGMKLTPLGGVKGSGWTANARPLVGKMKYFDGTGDGYTVENLAGDFDTTLKPSGSEARTHSFIYKTAVVDTDFGETILALTDTGTVASSAWFVCAEDNGISIGIAGARIIFAKGNLATNTSYHIVLRYPGGQLDATECFVNGVNQGAGSQETGTITNTPNTLATNGQNYELAAKNGSGSEYTGYLSEVGLWDRALRDAEIRTLAHDPSVVYSQPRRTYFMPEHFAYNLYNGTAADETTSSATLGICSDTPIENPIAPVSMVVTTSATPPAKEYIITGKDENGADAMWSGVDP